MFLDYSTQIRHSNIMHKNKQIDIEATTILMIFLVTLIPSGAVFKTLKVCVIRRYGNISTVVNMLSLIITTGIDHFSITFSNVIGTVWIVVATTYHHNILKYKIKNPHLSFCCCFSCMIFEENIYIIFYQLTKFHYLIAFTS